MAKRFTDTEKWKKPFIKELPTEYKLFWIYLLDDCDMAGIWHLDFEVAELRLGTKLSEKKALGFFSERIVVFDNGSKWFIPDFIKFQYIELSENNRAHKSVIATLKKYQLLENKPLESPFEGAKDKDKDKYKEKDKDKEEPPFFFITPPKPTIPTKEEVHEYFVRNGSTQELSLRFFNYYDGTGWMKGSSAIVKWTAMANTWIANPLAAEKLARIPANNNLKSASDLLKERGL